MGSSSGKIEDEYCQISGMIPGNKDYKPTYQNEKKGYSNNNAFKDNTSNNPKYGIKYNEKKKLFCHKWRKFNTK